MDYNTSDAGEAVGIVRSRLYTPNKARITVDDGSENIIINYSKDQDQKVTLVSDMNGKNGVLSVKSWEKYVNEWDRQQAKPNEVIILEECKNAKPVEFTVYESGKYSSPLDKEQRKYGNKMPEDHVPFEYNTDKKPQKKNSKKEVPEVLLSFREWGKGITTEDVEQQLYGNSHPPKPADLKESNGDGWPQLEENLDTIEIKSSKKQEEYVGNSILPVGPTGELIPGLDEWLTEYSDDVIRHSAPKGHEVATFEYDGPDTFTEETTIESTLESQVLQLFIDKGIEGVLDALYTTESACEVIKKTSFSQAADLYEFSSNQEFAAKFEFKRKELCEALGIEYKGVGAYPWKKMADATGIETKKLKKIIGQ